MKAILLIAVCVSIASPSDLPAQKASMAEPANTPTATAAAPATVETPVAHSLASAAPPAVCFLTQWASIKTQDSIRGYPPGTRLTVVGNFDDHLKVKAGDVEFEVKSDQVTNDPQIATQVLRQAQQQKIAQTDQIKGQRNNLGDLEARNNALQQEENDLLLQIGTAEQINYENGPLVAQLSLLRSRLNDVQNEKNKVRSQLEQAQRSLHKQP